ncbi:MAG TPA: hypothetical protein VMF90_12200 [Rhizobiaceae bacterium]|nr:hypothetical protein [Rhizobiaceae bacterium]
MIRVGYSTDVKTECGFVLTDVEVRLDVERRRGIWIVAGIYSLEGKNLLAPDVTRIDREIAGAVVDIAEDELLVRNSKLLRKVEEAASFEEA